MQTVKPFNFKQKTLLGGISRNFQESINCATKSQTTLLNRKAIPGELKMVKQRFNNK